MRWLLLDAQLLLAQGVWHATETPWLAVRGKAAQKAS
jgi:hypothetical protein